jgi:hypothetical protein
MSSSGTELLEVDGDVVVLLHVLRHRNSASTKLEKQPPSRFGAGSRSRCCMSSSGTRQVRKSRARIDEEGVELQPLQRIEALEQFVTDLAHLEAPEDTIFNARRKGQRQEMGMAVWSSRTGVDGGDLMGANDALTQVLSGLTSNRNDQCAPDYQVEWMMANISRCQSFMHLPLVTVRTSIEALRDGIHGEFWALSARLAPGLLLHHKWTESFVDYAIQFRPPPNFEILPGVACAVFDNYARRLLYKSMVTSTSSGYLYKMTNWGHFPLPRHLADADFNAHEICACPHTIEPLAHSLECL